MNQHSNDTLQTRRDTLHRRMTDLIMSGFTQRPSELIQAHAELWVDVEAFKRDFPGELLRD